MEAQIPNGTVEPAKAVELFAGVGGFRLALERSGWQVVWSNQWEPSTKRQHASDCYVQRFGAEGHSNEDISEVVQRLKAGAPPLPQHELLVGGFPCQDYSVAKVLNQARGLRGKKGVLWWDIEALIDMNRPQHIFLENVDRLLKSPAPQRGRDFAIILACLAERGYAVEWRVVNAADYGFPQRRRRVFLLGHRLDRLGDRFRDPHAWLTGDGVLARSLPVATWDPALTEEFPIVGDLVQLSETFGVGNRRSPFRNAGVMVDSKVWTASVEASYTGPRTVLGDVLLPARDVPDGHFIEESQLDRWRYLKGSKKERREDKKTGFTYWYNEGPVAFPDPLGQPSRTVLTGEGGSSPSRFKHVVETPDGRLRRLAPVELERLNGFPDDWTDTGMPSSRRAFMMGNALVVGAVERVAEHLLALLRKSSPASPSHLWGRSRSRTR